LEAAIGIEPMNKGFADLCLTTWLRRHSARIKDEGGRIKCAKGQKIKVKRQKSCRSPSTLWPSLLVLSFRPHQDWSGRRDLNSRPSPWQGDALPLSYSRFSTSFDSKDSR
jgi:hypothetical protein